MFLFSPRILNGCGGGHTEGSLCMFPGQHGDDTSRADEQGSSSDASTSTTSPHQIIQEVYLLFLAFVVVSAAIYCILRMRPCCPKAAVASGDEGADEEDEDLAAAALGVDDQGTLPEKAGLYRLRRSERKKVMERILEQRSYKYSPKICSCRNEDEKKRHIDIETGEALTNSVSITSHEEKSGADSQDGANNDFAILDSQEDLCFGKMCCICLTAYQDGDLVMTGSQCAHIFHSQCCQEWLLKQDHCPYCRVEIVKASEFREIAVEVLGTARVEVHSKPMIVPVSVEAAATQLSRRGTLSTTESSARTIRSVGNDVEVEEAHASFDIESGDAAFVQTSPDESDGQHRYPKDEERN